ncbi:cellular tumor antigen p53 [Adelges cooleyi]|uniref:cellular tumor antigen p53 n=1 Tax=Adelges cooleyi TaxID=133065 RepID=UPI00217FD54B|nr:cellular tumor antigen p53 [Adelges cooleyi]XP_050440254.1 cellular tumor antigen p53 [Adelges cooleyi]
MDDTKLLPSFTEVQQSCGNQGIYNFNMNEDQILNELINDNIHDMLINKNDIGEYAFTMPTENGTIVDLNLPPTPEKDQENRETCTAGSVKSSPTGIIPCQDEFGGSFNFEVLLDSSSQSYRQKWSYSVKLQKIFIDINKVLLLNFKYDSKLNDNTNVFVRAMPMYSAADYLKEPVGRCLQHLSPIDQINKGFGTWELGHVIRCDNENTSYHTDAISKRKSVITLLQRPDMGSDTSKLSYRFVCKTSCAGGMQRRPIIVIFTLEDEMGQVHGRRVLPVKICSCPKRDMEREESEKKMKPNTQFRRNKRCINQPTERHHHHHNHDHGHHDHPPNKVIKLESSQSTDCESDNAQDKCYTIPINYTTNSKKNYKAMLQGLYATFAGLSSLHNIDDTQNVLKDLKSKLNDLK